MPNFHKKKDEEANTSPEKDKAPGFSWFRNKEKKDDANEEEKPIIDDKKEAE